VRFADKSMDRATVGEPMRKARCLSGWKAPLRAVRYAFRGGGFWYVHEKQRGRLLPFTWLNVELPRGGLQ